MEQAFRPSQSSSAHKLLLAHAYLYRSADWCDRHSSIIQRMHTAKDFQGRQAHWSNSHDLAKPFGTEQRMQWHAAWLFWQVLTAHRSWFVLKLLLNDRACRNSPLSATGLLTDMLSRTKSSSRVSWNISEAGLEWHDCGRGSKSANLMKLLVSSSCKQDRYWWVPIHRNAFWCNVLNKVKCCHSVWVGLSLQTITKETWMQKIIVLLLYLPELHWILSQLQRLSLQYVRAWKTWKSAVVAWCLPWWTESGVLKTVQSPEPIAGLWCCGLR